MPSRWCFQVTNTESVNTVVTVMHNKIIIECPECGAIIDIYGRESCPRCGAAVDADYADILMDIEEEDAQEVDDWDVDYDEYDDDDEGVGHGFRYQEEEEEEQAECPECREEALEDLSDADCIDCDTMHKEALSRLYDDPDDRGCRINGRQMK